MAKESASSGGGREHTHEHAASARYEHQHPTYPISVGCRLGDSGRGKEEAPLVADDVSMDEDEDDDGAEQYVYTGASSGFERHDSVPELPSQRIMDDLPAVKKSRKRARKGKKSDTMIQPPQ